MSIPEEFKIEVETIRQLMDEFSYYQLLKVESSASPVQVQDAFFRESRTFHPDCYFACDDLEFKEHILSVYKRIAEAYGVLKDRDYRSLYDQQLQRHGGLRLDLAAVEAASRSAAVPETAAKTIQGRKFLTLAFDSLRQKDPGSAMKNFQFALSLEPQNELIRQYLEQTKRQLSERLPS